MDESKLVVVYDAPDETQSMLYRTMLEEAGIDVIERPMDLQSYFGSITQTGALFSQLLVRETDAPRALELVASFHEEAARGKLALNESDETEPPQA